MSGRVFGLIAVRDRYDRPETIRAGRIWQRAHLLATARGLAARPANAAVEVIDNERRLNLEPKTSARLAQFTGDICKMDELEPAEIRYATTSAWSPPPSRSRR